MENRKISPDILIVLNDIIKQTKNINVEQLRDYLVQNNIVQYISTSSIRNALKIHMGAKYRLIKKNNLAKNTLKTIEYRRYVAESLINEFTSNTMIISIDETSFSSYSKKIYKWILPNNVMDLTPYQNHSSHNISLIVAVSQYKVEGYMLIEGSVNQITFFNYIYELVTILRRNPDSVNHNFILLLDNLNAHKTYLLKCLTVRLRVRILFNAPYSPEINFVENVFQRIKEYQKKYEPVHTL